MTWDADAPADTVEANTIHTYIQGAKAMVSERLKVNNGTFNEHNVCVSAEDGKHVASKVGFIGVFSNYATLEAAERRAGALLYDSATKNLYVVDDALNLSLVTTLSHLSLQDLEDNGCHSGLFRRDGGSVMGGRIHLVSGAEITNQTYGTEDDDAADPAHATLSWLDGHGVDGVVGRMFAASVIKTGHLNVSSYSNPGGGPLYHDPNGLIGAVYGYDVIVGPGTLYLGRDGSGNIYTGTGGTMQYVYNREVRS